MKTTSFSSVAQLFAIEATPPTFAGRPTSCGVPEITASMCSAAPGSTSVTITLKGANWFFTQVRKVCQLAAPLVHAGMFTVLGGIDDEFERESSGPEVYV